MPASTENNISIKGVFWSIVRKVKKKRWISLGFIR